jgi:CO dehydrogenase maturation factor
VVGNKVTGAGDVAYLRADVGDDLLACFGQSGFVRAQEQGRALPLGDLEEDNLAVLDVLRGAVDACRKDWDTYQRQAVQFHLKNARAWASRAAGEDLAGQVDPGFVPGPAAWASVPALP